ncbi:hypothetical protein CRUP_007534 [Coryphaenoides rupestris]|nr:hypothetical protein CRUP_007534 [Coryphaenoides rupestris]
MSTVLIGNSTGCPSSWEFYGSSCYFFSRERKIWTDSRQDCLNRGADLVIINSKEEQEFAGSHNCRSWIGLSDKDSESNWKWVDGSRLNTPRFWAPDEPNNAGNEDCAELNSQEWNDLPCSVKRHWVCEKRFVERLGEACFSHSIGGEWPVQTVTHMNMLELCTVLKVYVNKQGGVRSSALHGAAVELWLWAH